MDTSKPIATKSKNSAKIKVSTCSQQQLKRQREWVYLAHFLALLQLHPRKTISGSDDGREPDFTCVFDSIENDKPYHIGIELTTLPRLRDRLGNENLMLKRWYWQSLLQVSTRFTPTRFNTAGQILCTSGRQAGRWQNLAQATIVTLPLSSRCDQTLNPTMRMKAHTKSKLWAMAHQLPQRMAKQLGLPSAFLADMTDYPVQLPVDSQITQADIDAVMQKKAHKVAAYRERRRLDELWLLIHTNEQQENGLLDIDVAARLTHHSGYNRVFMTRYPNDIILQLPQ